MLKQAVASVNLVLLIGCGDLAVKEVKPPESLPNIAETFLPDKLEAEPLLLKEMWWRQICDLEAVNSLWLAYTDQDMQRFPIAVANYSAKKVQINGLNPKLRPTSTSAPELADQLSRFELRFSLNTNKEQADCSGSPPILQTVVHFTRVPESREGAVEYGDGDAKLSEDLAAAGQAVKEKFNQGQMFFVCLTVQVYKASQACVDFSIKPSLKIWGCKKEIQDCPFDNLE